jgi:hypothetical protein
MLQVLVMDLYIDVKLPRTAANAPAREWITGAAVACTERCEGSASTPCPLQHNFTTPSPRLRHTFDTPHHPFTTPSPPLRHPFATRPSTPSTHGQHFYITPCRVREVELFEVRPSAPPHLRVVRPRSLLLGVEAQLDVESSS